MLVGAAVQGALGIGMGMIASPLLAIADHGFIPGAIVISVLPLSLAVILQEHHHIDRRGRRPGAARASTGRGRSG